MPKVNYEFDIWNEKFSTNKINQGGIYKIYFDGFPDHSYIGKTTQLAGFNQRLTNHKSSLWRIYSGLTTRGGALDRLGLLKQNEYRKLTVNEKKKYDEKLKKLRKQKIAQFENDYLIPGDSKYIKMIVFMEMNNLTFQDLRFEILVNENSLENDDLFDLEHRLIDEHQCYEKGFNATAMAEYTFGGVGERKNINSLIKMKEIILQKDADQYSQWNCWWNLYQTFKFSFLANSLGWLNFWKKISIEELAKNFSKLTLALFKENQSFRINKENMFTLQLMEKIKDEKNMNVLPILDFFVSNRKTIIIDKLMEIDKWIENDNFHFFNEYKTKDDEDYDFYMFYGSWEETTSFFQSNPFHNTLSINTLVQDNLTNYLNSYLLLKDTKKAFMIYQEILEKAKMKIPVQYFGRELTENFIFDYYFRENYLTSRLFSK